MEKPCGIIESDHEPNTARSTLSHVPNISWLGHPCHPRHRDFSAKITNCCPARIKHPESWIPAGLEQGKPAVLVGAGKAEPRTLHRDFWGSLQSPPSLNAQGPGTDLRSLKFILCYRFSSFPRHKFGAKQGGYEQVRIKERESVWVYF